MGRCPNPSDIVLSLLKCLLVPHSLSEALGRVSQNKRLIPDILVLAKPRATLSMGEKLHQR
jgi:hypothetical protein